MALPRTNTFQDHDMVVCLGLGDAAAAIHRSISCPFSGFVERIYFVSAADPAGDADVTIGTEGASTVVLTHATGAGIRTSTLAGDYNAMTSPITFSAGESINFDADGGGTSGGAFYATVVLRRQ